MRRRLAILAALPVLLLGAPAQAASPGRPVVVRVESGGFRWVDAAIGGAAGVGLAAASAGLYALYGRRR